MWKNLSPKQTQAIPCGAITNVPMNTQQRSMPVLKEKEIFKKTEQSQKHPERKLLSRAMAEWGGKVAQFLTWTAPWSLDWHPQTYQKIWPCAVCKGAEKQSTWWKKVYQCPVPSREGMLVCFSQPGARGEKSEFIHSLALSAMMMKRVKRVRASLIAYWLIQSKWSINVSLYYKHSRVLHYPTSAYFSSFFDCSFHSFQLFWAFICSSISFSLFCLQAMLLIFFVEFSSLTFPRASLVAQLVKNLPAVQETQVWFLGREDPLEKEMATHSGILAWRISWTEEPGGL